MGYITRQKLVVVIAKTWRTLCVLCFFKGFKCIIN